MLALAAVVIAVIVLALGYTALEIIQDAYSR